MGTGVNWPGLLHKCCLVLWLAYASAWAIGYLDWWIVVAYTAIVTVAWAETGNERWEPIAEG
jgi:hypothetical protein